MFFREWSPEEDDDDKRRRRGVEMTNKCQFVLAVAAGGGLDYPQTQRGTVNSLQHVHHFDSDPYLVQNHLHRNGYSLGE